MYIYTLIYIYNYINAFIFIYGILREQQLAPLMEKTIRVTLRTVTQTMIVQQEIMVSE